MHLDETSSIPFYQQIFDDFRAGIESGAYPAHSKLPSIRGLASDLGCSRNTIEAAYRLLVQEGFAKSRPGSGYTVQDASFLQATPPSSHAQTGGLLQEHLDSREAAAAAAAAKADASAGSAQGAGAARAADAPARFDFTYGNLQKGTFPAASWRTITDDILLSVERERADVYADPLGEHELRTEISWRLCALRGIKCTPEQIVVQGGTQSSVQNLLTLFDGTTDVVAMDDPGYDGVRAVIERNHFTVAPCRVMETPDAFMADVDASGARLIYVTPSSQFPTCKHMPLDTRERLIDWAAEHNAYILEDDYCRDFRYKDRPVPPLQSIDTRRRVIYMGTFSKSLSPALRMNYLVLPPELLERWREVFSGAYSAVPWLSQAVLARFLSSGLWDRHLRRLQARNRRKYELLIDALREHMGNKVEVMENGTGLHLLVNVPDGRTQPELIAAARKAGVQIYGTEQYWIRKENALPGCVLVGFSAIEEDDIEPGVRALAHAWFG
ncbi:MULTISPECIES: PLP-dependent aminotransferase family protein [unclassified Adlercreutzia]|uniref:MocR-like pyridoxine biosynthesis transcription factor PdxR n=1 Tax=unclassified Adlercreutzia TaxID=2636013 RepID=UPI0013EC002F|nr:MULTISPECIES: PLP-dependent aminotransferase family protein [unclassified Adlercreutzia]